MGGGVRKNDVDTSTYTNTTTGFGAPGWVELTFTPTGQPDFKVKINVGKIGDGPFINGKQYPPFFAPKANDLRPTAGQMIGKSRTAELATSTTKIPDLMDAWGNPIIFLRAARNVGPLAGTNVDRAQFLVLDDGGTKYGTMDPYLGSVSLGDSSLPQTKTGAGTSPIYTLFEDGSTAVDKKKLFAQFLRHPGFGDPTLPLSGTPRGKYLLISAGKDGIYFSRTDGLGNKTTPVTSTVILSKEGLAGLDNWDDIRMFGGG
jgi:hypothetical protein